MKVLIIGYGNPLRSDDALGLFAVRELREALGELDVEFLETQQLQLEHAVPVSCAEFVVFIDAAIQGVSGEIRYEWLKPAAGSRSISHNVDPSVLLATAWELYGHRCEAMLATVAGECFGYGTELTPEVRKSTTALVRRVADVVRQKVGEPAESRR